MTALTHSRSRPGDPRPMILRSTLTSPYGRKARMAAQVLALDHLIEVVPADAQDPDDDLRLQNPLGKMPCLIVGGDIYFDSRVILHYFDALAGGGRLLPEQGEERFRLLTFEALADGITDASLLITYEGRFREAHQVSERWLEHQRGKVVRGLAACQKALPDPAVTNLASIALSAALGYLDWRRHLPWRQDFPVLAAWLEAYAASEPSFNATRSPA
ncbi:MAG: glutathione S-transferase N-terminal domain-containing protein [Alphaproteobacteria bacterium]